MITIRFLRVGKKHQPIFRIVVTDRRNPPRGGRFLEIVGFFNPITKEKQIKRERVNYWMSVGAKPSDTVHNLLIKAGIIKGAKKDVSVQARRRGKAAGTGKTGAPVSAEKAVGAERAA